MQSQVYENKYYIVRLRSEAPQYEVVNKRHGVVDYHCPSEPEAIGCAEWAAATLESYFELDAPPPPPLRSLN